MSHLIFVATIFLDWIWSSMVFFHRFKSRKTDMGAKFVLPFKFIRAITLVLLNLFLFVEP